jgi:dolichyl-diphosphooligosaccharide--protein glycosyltransferase
MKFSISVEKIRDVAKPAFIIKHWWLWSLILITVFALWSRSIPAKYGELQALDPFYAYRLNEYMLANNLQLPQHDYMRYWPDGVPIRQYGPLVYFYIPVILYLVFVFFGISMPFLNFAILYPAIMGAASVFIIFWIGKEIFNSKKAGLFASIFLATMPAYISRTSAGFFDKEATGGTLLLLTVYLFIKAYKTNSWKWGLLCPIALFLAMGSWGGAQFFIFFISGFVIIKLLLNQYKESMLKSVLPALIVAVLTQRILLGYSNWTFEQVLAVVTITLIAARFVPEKFKLLKEEQIQYIIPATLIIMIVFVLVGSMFSDFLWEIVKRGTSLIYLEQTPEVDYIAMTVAEQMPGTWNEIVSRANIAFSRSLIPTVAPFDTLFSVWFLMLMGALAILYNIYSKREWILMLPLIWLAMSIQTVFYMVRLVFFLAPPAALVAGFFVAEGIKRFSELDYMKNREGIKKLNVASIPLIALVSFLIVSNLATGYVFCSSVGPSFNQYWRESMEYMSENTPENASILSWWDFGYWFQTRGNRPSTADGGNIYGVVDEQIADWFTADGQNWTEFRPWLQEKDVSYILMDYTLPGKYGAISRIASRGREVVGMLQFSQTAAYPQANKTIIEFKAGQYTIWLPVGDTGNIAGPPIFMISQGEQYVGRTYINDICTTNGIIRMESPEDANTMPGCISITAYGLFFIPPEAEFTIFTNLMFMDGYGVGDVEKVFDNQLIKIYKLEINETASS